MIAGGKTVSCEVDIGLAEPCRFLCTTGVRSDSLHHVLGFAVVGRLICCAVLRCAALRCAVLCCAAGCCGNLQELLSRSHSHCTHLSGCIAHQLRLAPAPAGYVIISVPSPNIVCLAAFCANPIHPTTATSRKGNQFNEAQQCMFGCKSAVIVISVDTFGVVTGDVWDCRHQPAMGSQQRAVCVGRLPGSNSIGSGVLHACAGAGCAPLS